MNRKPIAILISDVHYNLVTLDVADTVMNMAIEIAYEYDLPLVVAGDLHDTKANIRGECLSAMIDTFQHASKCLPAVHVLRGNHDAINEKSKEHSLSFLGSMVVTEPKRIGLNDEGVWLIPYQHDPIKFEEIISSIPKNEMIIMHQGVQGALPGDYIIDKSAVSKASLSGRRAISGHYHARQHIKLPESGVLSYIGNPYTLGFGEAKDPSKGIQILFNDGYMEFVDTNVRKHVVVTDLENPPDIAWDDLVWVKTNKKITREEVKTKLQLVQDFRLEYIPVEVKAENESQLDHLTKAELLDKLIDDLNNVDPDQKERLKLMWKILCE